MCGPTVEQNGIQSAEENYWKSFLTSNDIVSYALGISDSPSTDDLDPIAFNGASNTDLDSIIVTDLVAERRDRALRYGATRVLDPREIDIATAGLDVNAFVDASGSPRAVMSGIKAVRPAGTAVLVGLGSSEMNLPVEHIQNLEITVTGIFRYTDTWPAAIHLVASGAVDLDSLVTGRFDLERADEALESDQDPNSLKSVVYPNGEPKVDQ